MSKCIARTIAVDFDGCLHSGVYPDIGLPNSDAINRLIDNQNAGGKVILWTCRGGRDLEDAVIWCRNRGLRFDAINDNLPEHIAEFKNNSRKVYADEYWDDKAVHIECEK